MHWLAGSNAKGFLNKMWRHVGALDDSVAIRYREPFTEFVHNGTPVRFYRDVNLTEKHLLELSPADAKEIRRLCGWIRNLNGLEQPVTDLRGVRVTKKKRLPLSMLFAALPLIRVFAALSKLSRDEYINRFTHEGIRELMRSITFEKSGLFPLVFTMGALARGDGGFPEGGSLPFVERIVKKFTEMGGEILYKTRADKVIVENGKVAGVLAGDKKMSADAVIITADTMAVDHLFDVPPKAKWLDDMKATTEPTMATFVCLGIKADLRKYHCYYSFKLTTPIKLANETFESISLSNYAADPAYSSAGKSAVTIQLPGDTYDFWKKAREEGRYDDEKKQLANDVIAALSVQIPEVAGNVEIISVATPLTYERYCANWKGSWMTEITRDMKMRAYPGVISSPQGVYFAGHRLMPPGGLPPAIMTARAAVQHLCRDTGTLFVSEEC
jgi:phytoene dehydrogenase-like protein